MNKKNELNRSLPKLGNIQYKNDSVHISFTTKKFSLFKKLNYFQSLLQVNLVCFDVCDDSNFIF